VKADAARVKTWAQTPSITSPLRLTRQISGDIGYGVVRKTGKLVSGNKVMVLIKKEKYNGMPYYILTAFIDL